LEAVARTLGRLASPDPAATAASRASSNALDPPVDVDAQGVYATLCLLEHLCAAGGAAVADAVAAAVVPLVDGANDAVTTPGCTVLSFLLERANRASQCLLSFVQQRAKAADGPSPAAIASDALVRFLDENTQMCGELLSLLLAHPATASRLASLQCRLTPVGVPAKASGPGCGRAVNGIELLLDTINRHRRRHGLLENIQSAAAAKSAAAAAGGGGTASAPMLLSRSGAEAEFILNLCDSLCAGLLDANGACKRQLLEADGVELLVQATREAGYLRFPALKALAFALEGAALDAPYARPTVTATGAGGKEGGVPRVSVGAAALSLGAALCERFLNAGGARVLFPAFLGKGAAHTAAVHGQKQAKTEEENAIAILAACFRHLPSPSAATLASVPSAAGEDSAAASGSGLHKVRLVAKFAGANNDKAERLVLLFSKYSKHVASVMRAQEKEANADEDEDEDAVREAFYLERLENGLSQLQGLAFVVASLVALPATVTKCPAPWQQLCSQISLQVRSALYERGESTLSVLDVLADQARQLRVQKGVSDLDAAAAVLSSLDSLVSDVEGVAGLGRDPAEARDGGAVLG
jgi:hypothetical protein